jgi:hypothetical protein
MKTLKFEKHLSEMILRGEKDVTWRLFDDKDLSVGDRVMCLVAGTLEPFATIVLREVRETILGKLAPEDWDGHEKFQSEDEMYETYSRYYNRPIDTSTPIKVIRFEVENE